MREWSEKRGNKQRTWGFSTISTPQNSNRSKNAGKNQLIALGHLIPLKRWNGLLLENRGVKRCGVETVVYSFFFWNPLFIFQIGNPFFGESWGTDCYHGFLWSWRVHSLILGGGNDLGDLIVISMWLPFRSSCQVPVHSQPDADRWSPELNLFVMWCRSFGATTTCNNSTDRKDLEMWSVLQ